MSNMRDDAPAFDLRQLVDAANACYARADDKALPLSVRAKFARAADALVAAIDAHHEATADPPPKIGGYINDRCGVCGRVWSLHTIECANDRNRPTDESGREVPDWELPGWVKEGAAQLQAGGPVERAKALIAALDEDAPPGKVLHGALKAAIIAQANGMEYGKRAGSGSMNGGLKDG